ncbi:hypothetical protein [Henriciella litoralis]|uniref:hypothetical protein n=1 Tax=Henriciella litoralis TaxID=568102 RepID=UPI000A061EED|nr:hypothetical protein [Henriciella litoralis]
MRALILPASFLFLIAACAVPTPTGEGPTGEGPVTGETGYAPIRFEGEKATPAERARCEAAGGSVQRAGMLGWENCIQMMPDAGEMCRDSSDCFSECRVSSEAPADPGTPTTGQCAPTDSPFGCYQRVKDGVADGMICVD